MRIIQDCAGLCTSAGLVNHRGMKFTKAFDLSSIYNIDFGKAATNRLLDEYMCSIGKKGMNSKNVDTCI